MDAVLYLTDAATVTGHILSCDGGSFRPLVIGRGVCHDHKHNHRPGQ